jgi:hypothetical protein
MRVENEIKLRTIWPCLSHVMIVRGDCLFQLLCLYNVNVCLGQPEKHVNRTPWQGTNPDAICNHQSAPPCNNLSWKLTLVSTMSPNEGEASEDSGEAAQASVQPADSGTAPVKKKTISCTQCRRRKLKCDRVKPSCGTCSRLRHQCVYPEGRMKSTMKRRNVKDLEARLGMSPKDLLSAASVLSLLQ